MSDFESEYFAPLQILNLDWDYITTTEEYQDDFAFLQTMIVQSFGNSRIFPDMNVFSQVMAHLFSVYRYFIRHIPDTTDLDESPFLQYLQKELGFDLPLTSSIPVVEMLREAKQWFARKGSQSLYPFIGAVVGSPIELDYPKLLILTTDDDATYIDGATGQDAQSLPFDESKLGIIEDGIYWSDFVYVVKVLQAQDVVNFTDLQNLLLSVHPAGFQMYIQMIFNYIPDIPVVQTTLVLGDDIITDTFWTPIQFHTIDNNFLTDDPLSLTDMSYGDYTLTDTWLNQIDLYDEVRDGIPHMLWIDTLTHPYLSNRPWATFSRIVNNSDLTTTTVYSDTDSYLYQNQTTNMGMASYTYADVENLTYQETQNVAYDLDQANMHGLDFFPYMPMANVTLL